MIIYCMLICMYIYIRIYIYMRIYIYGTRGATSSTQLQQQGPLSQSRPAQTSGSARP